MTIEEFVVWKVLPERKNARLIKPIALNMYNTQSLVVWDSTITLDFIIIKNTYFLKNVPKKKIYA